MLPSRWSRQIVLTIACIATLMPDLRFERADGAGGTH